MSTFQPSGMIKWPRLEDQNIFPLTHVYLLPLDITGMSETEIAESRKVNQHISSAYDEFA